MQLKLISIRVVKFFKICAVICIACPYGVPLSFEPQVYVTHPQFISFKVNLLFREMSPLEFLHQLSGHAMLIIDC